VESDDYWTLATVLELALVGADEELVGRVLPRLLTADSESWMRQTTLSTVERLISVRQKRGSVDVLKRVAGALRS